MKFTFYKNRMYSVNTHYRRLGEMLINTKSAIIFTILGCLLLGEISFAEEKITLQTSKYPDFALEYLGPDKFEGFNRKMFSFNQKLNKYAIRPVHILWASIMPQYGMDRIKSATKNIEYPIRLMSTLIQRDFKASGTETLRFLANTTIGLGGLYDPATSLFKIPAADENMDQALAKCKIKSGPYIVVPVLTGTTPRGLVGRGLDTALNPSCYIATPVLAAVKAGLLVNKTSYMQPLFKMVESNYADPYDIARKLYGIQNYIQCENLDRKDVLEATGKILDKEEDELVLDEIELADAELIIKNNEKEKSIQEELSISEIAQAGEEIDDIILKTYNNKNSKLLADKILFDYKPQCPVVDSMRTVLFDLPEINDSIWNELSVWNRCFCKKIKTSSVNIHPERDDYKFKFILQKEKNSPLAIIYPSIGEGVSSHHSVVLAKLFYDEGYSVVIQGSNFQWEFVKSMPDGYRPGIPSNDADYLKTVTGKIITKLQDKYEREFPEKTVIGTSFGAIATLFLADKEYKNPTLGITKYISVNPPVELMYAMKQIDKNTAEWNKNPENLKERTAVTAAKILQITQAKDFSEEDIGTMPFTEDEGKLITGFIMHQKLSDVVFTIENASKTKKTAIYDTLNNITYEDYAKKYLLNDMYANIEDLDFVTSLYSIADYLKNSDNYKIYHTLDDYLVNHKQLKDLKQISKDKLVLFDHGAHLGFLYRDEFLTELKKDIQKPHVAAKE